MPRERMDFAIFWLPILGPIFIGLAAAVWYGGSKTTGLWIGFAGAVCLLTTIALQVQRGIDSGMGKEAMTQPPRPPSNTMGPIVGNQGIITQGQIGTNTQNTIVEREHLVLDDAEVAAVGKRLAAFAGRKTKIFLNRETPETLVFGTRLAAALKLAQIEVVEIAHMEVMGAMPPGLLFYLTKTNPGDLAFAQAIAAALAEVGIVKDKVPTEYANNDVLTIYVTPL